MPNGDYSGPAPEAGRAPYMALYRRWRPQLFAQVLGQEHVTRSLQNALAGGRIAHAYLFCGQRGTGKTTMAKLLGKALNCLEGVQAEPCNRCRSCVEVTEGRNLDVLEIDAASNRGIDEIRDLREKVRYAPAQNRYKVYIIDEVHMLTPEAFNALLKILEEPPARVVFILATTEAHRIPLTIVSRCQRFDFHLLEVEQLAARLRDVAATMSFSLDEKTLILLARQAEGAVRDALGLLEQCRAYGGEGISYDQALEILGLPAPEILHRYYQAVIEEDLATGLSIVHEVVWRGMDLQRILKEMALYLRKLLLLQAADDDGAATLADVPSYRHYLLQHRDKFDHTVILEMLEILQQLGFQLRGATQPQFLLELTFLRLVRVYRFRSYLSPQGLFQSLEQLEQKLLAAGKSGLETGFAAIEVKSGQTELTSAKKTSITDKIEDSKLCAAAAYESECSTTTASDTTKALSLSTVEERNSFWEGLFLAKLKQERKHNLVAYLMEAFPLSWKGGIFAISIPAKHAYLKKRLEDGANRKYMEKLLHELLGTEASLQVIVGSPPQEMAASAREVNNAATTAAGGQDKEKKPAAAGGTKQAGNNYMVRQVLELFQGRLIDGGEVTHNRDKRKLAPPASWLESEDDIPLPEPPPLEDEDD